MSSDIEICQNRKFSEFSDCLEFDAENEMNNFPAYNWNMNQKNSIETSMKKFEPEVTEKRCLNLEDSI